MTTEYPLVETPLTLAGREWRITCVTDQDALVARVETDDDLANFPFGLMLWASAVALGEALVSEGVAGRRVLELGAGVGLAGLVAAYLGAQVTQTDYHPDALTLCRHNAAQNGVAGLTVQTGDWRSWPNTLRGFDLVIGADILYERTMHPYLAALLPTLGGALWIADPLRPQAADFLTARQREGWIVQTTRHDVSWEGDPREIALHRIQCPS